MERDAGFVGGAARPLARESPSTRPRPSSLTTPGEHGATQLVGLRRARRWESDNTVQARTRAVNARPPSRSVAWKRSPSTSLPFTAASDAAAVSPRLRTRISSIPSVSRGRAGLSPFMASDTLRQPQCRMPQRLFRASGDLRSAPGAAVDGGTATGVTPSRISSRSAVTAWCIAPRSWAPSCASRLTERDAVRATLLVAPRAACSGRSRSTLTAYR